MANTPSSPQNQKVRLLTYTLPGGWQILVGRTDADNDVLSFRVAKPVVYLHRAGNSRSPQTRYNAPISPPCEGATR
jgi:hypothetical protein